MRQRPDQKPPRLACKLLKFYCKNELLDSIEGDLEEQFFLDLDRFSLRKSNWRYWLNVLTFINRFTLKKDSSNRKTHNNSIAMIRNYALIALRNLKRKPVFSVINLLGLAIGLATCMIIYFYIQHETSFDQFHSNADRIYRVTNVYERPNGTSRWVRTPPALAPAIRDNFPGIGLVTRMRYAGDHVCSIENNSFQVDHGLYADSLFLKMFDFELLIGNTDEALDEPNSIVLGKNLAERLFGQTNPVGKVLRFDNLHDLKVTGVLDELPTNSHLRFEYLISFSTYVVPDGYLADLNSWGWGGFYTYIMVNEHLDVDNLQKGIDALFNENYNSDQTKASAPLQPLSRLYLEYSDFSNLGGAVKVGSKPTIYALSAIALLVLVIASLNFMNLSTAMSISRNKEIAMRKVMGAVKGRIRTQFLTESIFFALGSMLLGILIVWTVSPVFGALLDIALPRSADLYLEALPIFLLFALAIGLVAGVYPAMVLSAFSPIAAMKGQLKTTSGNWMRKGLTTFQFVISIGLITISLLVIRQINFMRAQPLGFERENVFAINLFAEDMLTHYDAVKNTFLSNPMVSGISRSSHAFEGGSSSGPARLVGAASEDSHQLAYYQTGYDFLDLMKIELLEGRFFSKDFPNDTAQALVLNESAVKELGLEEPIGTRIHFNNRDRRVIGVVRDFNISSLHTPIRPMGIVMPFATLRTILVKVNSSQLGRTLSALEKEWQQIVPRAPFDVQFLDDTIAELYEREERLSKLIGIFATLAVFLACLGLYGLVSFSVQSRLKEVSIRKVLGASVKGMLILLSKQFLTIIVVASLVAWPLSYFVGNDWLNNFSYRTNIPLSLFLMPLVLLVAMTLVTLSHHVIKAALVNPVKVLRNE